MADIKREFIDLEIGDIEQIHMVNAVKFRLSYLKDGYCTTDKQRAELLHLQELVKQFPDDWELFFEERAIRVAEESRVRKAFIKARNQLLKARKEAAKTPEEKADDAKKADEKDKLKRIKEYNSNLRKLRKKAAGNIYLAEGEKQYGRGIQSYQF